MAIFWKKLYCSQGIIALVVFSDFKSPRAYSGEMAKKETGRLKKRDQEVFKLSITLTFKKWSLGLSGKNRKQLSWNSCGRHYINCCVVWMQKGLNFVNVHFMDVQKSSNQAKIFIILGSVRFLLASLLWSTWGQTYCGFLMLSRKVHLHPEKILHLSHVSNCILIGKSLEWGHSWEGWHISPAKTGWETEIGQPGEGKMSERLGLKGSCNTEL